MISNNRKTATQIINSMSENKLPYVIKILRKINNTYENVEPDEWDLNLLTQAQKENDGTVISIEDLAKDLGIEL